VPNERGDGTGTIRTRGRTAVELRMGRHWTGGLRTVRTDHGRVEIDFGGPVDGGLRYEIRSAGNSSTGRRSLGTFTYAEIGKCMNRTALHFRVAFFEIESGDVLMYAYEPSPAAANPSRFTRAAGDESACWSADGPAR